MSLKEQTCPSDIVVCTSTPNDHIRRLADRYGLPLYINENGGNIAADWNFAYSKAQTQLVTIAHQDDVYNTEYSASVLRAKEKYPDMSLYTTASLTLMEDTPKKNGSIEYVKKFLRSPLRDPERNDDTRIKLKALRYGNPIICPACTYDKDMCGRNIFDEKYAFVVDWDALLRLASCPGRWVCNEKPLINYRIHSGAATSRLIHDHVREREEAEMFSRLMPPLVAGIYGKVYRLSYAAYK